MSSMVLEALRDQLVADGVENPEVRDDHVWVHRSQERKLRGLRYILTLEIRKTGCKIAPSKQFVEYVHGRTE